jgi:hypothetical protein
MVATLIGNRSGELRVSGQGLHEVIGYALREVLGNFQRNHKVESTSKVEALFKVNNFNEMGFDLQFGLVKPRTLYPSDVRYAA